MKSKKTLIKKDKIQKPKVIKKISKEKMKELKLLPKWKKVTGGIHNHGDGQLVKKDGFLYAEEWEIPKRLIEKKVFEFVRGGKKKTVSKKKAKGLRIVPGVEEDTFDVLNTDGEPINDEALTKEEADNLVKGN